MADLEKEEIRRKMGDIKENSRGYLSALYIVLIWLGLTAAFTGLGVYTSWLPYLYGFTTLILLFTTVFYWKKISSPAGNTWRNILGFGTVLTGLTTSAIYLSKFEQQLFTLSIIFWIAAPGYGFKINSDFITSFRERFAILSHISVFATLTYLLGSFTSSNLAVGISFVSTALAQSYGALTILNMIDE